MQGYGQCINSQLPIWMIFANWIGVYYWILTKIGNSQLLFTIKQNRNINFNCLLNECNEQVMFIELCSSFDMTGPSYRKCIFPRFELTAGKCKNVIVQYHIGLKSESYINISMNTSDVSPFRKIEINCATRYFWRTMNVNISVLWKGGQSGLVREHYH